MQRTVARSRVLMMVVGAVLAIACGSLILAKILAQPTARQTAIDNAIELAWQQTHAVADRAATLMATDDEWNSGHSQTIEQEFHGTQIVDYHQGAEGNMEVDIATLTEAEGSRLFDHQHVAAILCARITVNSDGITEPTTWGISCDGALPLESWPEGVSFVYISRP